MINSNRPWLLTAIRSLFDNSFPYSNWWRHLMTSQVGLTYYRLYWMVLFNRHNKKNQEITNNYDVIHRVYTVRLLCGWWFPFQLGVVMISHMSPNFENCIFKKKRKMRFEIITSWFKFQLTSSNVLGCSEGSYIHKYIHI